VVAAKRASGDYADAAKGRTPVIPAYDARSITPARHNPELGIFAGPGQVLGYLGRYTHHVAIANSRLVGLDDGQVSFTWKDYRQDGKTKVMTLAADEFIRRFLQHTVPDGFHRIRHIGFLANRHRTAKLTLCRDLLAAPPPPDPEPPRRWQDRLRDLTGHDIEVCPGCGGRMLPHSTLRPCPPPRPPMWCDSS